MDKNLLHHIYQPSPCLGKDEVRAYQEGKLAGGNLRRVENHLLDCPLCSDAVEGLKLYLPSPGLDLKHFSVFKKNLEASRGGVIRKIDPYRVMKRAVSIAALFAVGLFAYLSFFQSPDGEKLYQQFYTAYENDIPLNLRSTDSAQLLSPVFEKALNSYSLGQFAASIPQFEETLEGDPGNITARYFAGLACLENNQPEKAAGYFENVAGTSGTYAQKASWYLVLARLKMGEMDKARALLDEYVKRGGFKAREATELLDKL